MLRYQNNNNNEYEIMFDSIKRISVIDNLIKLMNKIINDGGKTIIFNFSKMKEQSYSSVHVSIAGIAKYYEEHKNIKIVYKGDEGKYIGTTNINSPLFVSENEKMLNNNIFDKVIIFSSTEDSSFISNELIRQLSHLFVLQDGVLEGLSWCINEIMDNVFNHSNSTHGYIMAQVHERKKHIQISIFDTGIGLKKSLSKSGEYTIKSEKEAIELSMEKGVSGNREIGQGNGLWGLKQIVSENKGNLSIYSGRTYLAYDFSTGKEKISNNLAVISNDDLCTRIDFMLNFKNPTNIEKALDYKPFEKISRDIEQMTNDYGQIVYNVLKESNGALGTRVDGKRLRNHLINTIRNSEGTIIIDFSEVKMITSSFADEFIGKTIYEIGLVQFCSKIKIVGANKYVEGLVNKAIIYRQN